MKYAAAKKTGGSRPVSNIQYYKSPDELGERLYLLIGSKQGGKVSVIIIIIIIIIIQQMPTRQMLTSAIQTQHTCGLQQYQSKRFGHNALLQLFTITINGSSSDG